MLAGLAVFEQDIYFYSQEMDSVQREYFPEEVESLLFHVTKLRVPDSEKLEEPWCRIKRNKRLELKDKIYDIIGNKHGVLFGCVVEKKVSIARNEDPYESAFEDLVSRFDMYLSRLNRRLQFENRDEQRGLIVLAESSYEKTIALLGRRLRSEGTRWGILHNVSDVPLFAPSKDTRLLQYADFCSNAIYGRYHRGLASDFDKIAHKFDQEGGVIHGLSHKTTNQNCACISCSSRRTRLL